MISKGVLANQKLFRLSQPIATRFVQLYKSPNLFFNRSFLFLFLYKQLCLFVHVPRYYLVVCASSDSESSHSFCLQSPKRTPTKSRTAPKSTVAVADAPNEEEKWRKW
jgi:hypothetical protein